VIRTKKPIPFKAAVIIFTLFILVSICPTIPVLGYLTITFVNVGAEATGTGAVTPALPASMVSGDICILVATTIAGGTVTITATGSITTWTAIAGSPVDVTGGEKLYVWWGLWTSGTTGPTVTPGSDHIEAGIGAWRNCIASPIDVTQTGTETTSDTTFSFATSISTTVDGCMVLAICTTGTDIATNGQFTVMTDTSLTSLAERMDYETSSGGGGGFALDQGYKTTAGAVGTWASTLTTASTKAYISFALKPVSAQAYTVALTQGISSTWAVSTQWIVNSPLSQAMSTTWNIAIVSVFSVPLSQSASTSWGAAISQGYILALSQTISTVINVAAKWDSLVGLSGSITSTWGAILSATFHAGLSEIITTTWDVLTASIFHTALGLPVSTIWDVAIGWDANVALARAITTTWSAVLSSVFNVELSKNIATTWETQINWDATTNLFQSVTTTWEVIVSGINNPELPPNDHSEGSNRDDPNVDPPDPSTTIFDSILEWICNIRLPEINICLPEINLPKLPQVFDTDEVQHLTVIVMVGLFAFILLKKKKPS